MMLSIFYNSKFILMATSLGTNAVVVTRVHCTLIGVQRQKKITFRSACVFRSVSSLGASWIVIDANIFHTGNEDSEQTVRMRRLNHAHVRRYVF